MISSKLSPNASSPPAISAERMLDAAAGEERSTADLTGWEAAQALRECISFGAGKVTGLRARGLQPDEYCKETPDGWSVQLPPRDHGQDVA